MSILTKPEAKIMISIIETGDAPTLAPEPDGRSIRERGDALRAEGSTFWGLSGRGLIAFDMKRDRWTVTAKGLNELALWAGV
jgi:hypothetical protein